MQGNLYFSIQEKYHSEIKYLQNFCRINNEAGLIIYNNNEEGLDFAIEFLISQNAIIIKQDDIQNIVTLNNYFFDNTIYIIKNIDFLLEQNNNAMYEIFLKQIIDIVYNKGLKIVLTAKKEINNTTLPDLLSRIKSFHCLYV